MPLQATSGAASYDAFGGGVPVEPVYIEQIFQTYLYTGNGSTQTITNGIDLSTKGGLVWLKSRQAVSHALFTTAQGAGTEFLSSNRTDTIADATALTSFNTTGFTLGAGASGWTNTSPQPYASWTFRKQPKFFDVVTYTGDSVFDRVISHNLGAVPAVIIIKCTSSATDWVVRTTVIDGSMDLLFLNLTNAKTDSSVSNTWSSSTFTVGAAASDNQTGQTYVAYLFASNAGGFGLTGTDNVISCGSWTGTGSNLAVNLGYEPQWLMFKRTDDVGDWIIVDNMRGFTTTGADAYLKPNTSGAETSVTGAPAVNATGFSWATGAGTNFIYIAIRRGPMKVPTTGTSVFSPVAYSGTGATRTITAGFPVDLAIPKLRNAATNGAEWYTRLIGPEIALLSSGAFQQLSRTTELTSFASNTGVVLGSSSTSGGTNASGSTYVDWNFARAPSFFDVVCYTGTGANRTVTHNLTVVPELLMVKRRDATASWHVGSTLFPNYGDELSLNSTASIAAGNVWQNTPNTATYFTLRTNTDVNANGGTYVAYLFATCAGVSKVFSYTGNGSSQTINCGFTAGSRWVMIKRTDSAGDWYVWDSARGIVSGNDPHLSLNTTDAEVTTDDSVDTDSTGFIVNQLSATNVNVTSATYIGLAIA